MKSDVVERIAQAIRDRLREAGVSPEDIATVVASLDGLKQSAPEDEQAQRDALNALSKDELIALLIEARAAQGRNAEQVAALGLLMASYHEKARTVAAEPKAVRRSFGYGAGAFLALGLLGALGLAALAGVDVRAAGRDSLGWMQSRLGVVRAP